MSFARTLIAVTGTHSTGKSTFLADLRTRLEALGLKIGGVESVATRAMQLGFPILKDHVYESTLWIIAEVMRQEMEASLVNDVVLVDRPVVDALGYLHAALDLTGRSAPSERLDELKRIVAAHQSRYDWTAVTELDEAVPLGDGRDQDEAFRRAAAAHISALVAELCPGAVSLTLANREAMLAEAANVITARFY